LQHISLASGRAVFSSCGADPSKAKKRLPSPNLHVSWPRGPQAAARPRPTPPPQPDSQFAVRSPPPPPGPGPAGPVGRGPWACRRVPARAAATRSALHFLYVPHINNRPLKTILSYAKLKLNRRVGRQRQPKVFFTLRAPD
jgi:hypothetical protein